MYTRVLVRRDGDHLKASRAEILLELVQNFDGLDAVRRNRCEITAISITLPWYCFRLMVLPSGTGMDMSANGRGCDAQTAKDAQCKASDTTTMF